MKNTFSSLLLVMVILTTSCNKWLDVSPQTQIRERVLFETELGFQDALAGCYINLAGSNLYGQHLTMGFLDVLGQRYSATTSSSHPFYRAGRYEYNDATVKSTYINNIWSNLFTTVGNVNNVLTQIDGKKSLFNGNNYNLIKGEALGLRALLHFEALRGFGPAPVVDGSRKSIPYVTSFGKTIYPLLSVNEVLDSCLNDLQLATQLLNEEKTVRTDYVQDPFRSYTRNHMNYYAVRGLMARIYLYRGDKANALLHAKSVIDEGGSQFPFVTAAQAAATTNRHRSFPTEHLFGVSAFKINDYVNAYFKTTSTNGSPSFFSSTATLTALYETTSGGSSDFRFNYQYDLYPQGYATSKYHQENLTTEFLTKNIPIIRLSEMYYIAAECEPNTLLAVGFLNTIRQNRGLTPLATGISSTILEGEILKEYKKETYAEGQLFYYFKRKNTARVDGSSISMSDATWIFPLPENEIEFGKRF